MVKPCDPKATALAFRPIKLRRFGLISPKRIKYNPW